MVKKPKNFDGKKFCEKYNLTVIDFYAEDDNLICPSLPDLVDADLLDCLPDPPPDKEIFSLPIQAPAIYADDIFVSSRDVKDDPDEAFVEAKAETEKAKGEPKSLDLISRSTLKAVEKAREEIKELKQKLKDRTDEIAKLKLDMQALADEIKEIKKKLK